MSGTMSPFTAQALMKALGAQGPSKIDPSQPWNPAANMGAPNWGASGGGKGGAQASSPGMAQQASAPQNAYGSNATINPDWTGNGVARGVGVTQAQVDAANAGNPYQRDASDIDEQMYGKDRANIMAYAGSIQANQPVPADVQASIDKLKQAGVYSPVDLGSYSGG